MKCACSENQVNAKVARLNALFVFAVTLVYLLTPYKWVVYVLLADFFIKGAFHPKFSPISRISAYFLDLIGEKPRPIFAPPKLFANKVGLVFSIIISILTAAGYWTAPEIFAIVLAIFAFLEFAFEFCMGCWVYDLYYKIERSQE